MPAADILLLIGLNSCIYLDNDRKITDFIDYKLGNSIEETSSHFTQEFIPGFNQVNVNDREYSFTFNTKSVLVSKYFGFIMHQNGPDIFTAKNVLGQFLDCFNRTQQKYLYNNYFENKTRNHFEFHWSDEETSSYVRVDQSIGDKILISYGSLLKSYMTEKLSDRRTPQSNRF